MKKYISILLCAVMILSLLAGCNNDGTEPTETTKHKHTYSSEWSHDENNHWYQATCEHSTLQANLGEHVDENLDGVCDICAYESQTCEHTFSEAWTSDATSHWHAATCNHIGATADKADHADEDNDGACDVCGYMGEHEHTFEDAWASNENKHWHNASCGHNVVDAEAAHEDVTNDGACDICGWFDASHTHTFSEAWTSDVTYHWHGATCEHLGAITDKAQHADGDENGYCDVCEYLMCTHEDFDLDGECDICGGPLDPDHTHEYGSEIGSDVTGHWYVSTCHPGATSPKEDHVDQNNDGVCDVCKFQICGHSYDLNWTSNDTHHWHAILCTCSIERKNYEPHVDADGDGGCDVCMFGLPVPAVYEVIVDHEPYTFRHTSMLCYSTFTVYFPQPGRYVITPDNDQFDVLVSKDSQSNSYYLTLDVEVAGEMTLYFRNFNFNYKEGMETTFTYTVIRMDDLILETMQGKVELPSNTIYTIKFVAPQVGTYKLISSVDGLVIGLTESSMEYFKGHIELDVEYVGQEFTLYVFYESATQLSFVFDWRLEEPFCLQVGEGSYAVDVGPTQVDYMVSFTAPEAGYYLLKLNNHWLTFAQMGDIYDTPVRLETMEVLTHYMEAGEVYTIWIQTVYNYPEATRCYDTLTISNVGELLSNIGGTVTPGAEGGRYCIQASETSYYRFEISGGELGVIASNGNVTWTSAPYEVNLEKGQTCSFMLRGAGAVTVKISTVTYTLDLADGPNAVYMEPNKYYTIHFQYHTTDKDGNPILVDMDSNSTISLNWEGNLTVYVNGEPYTRGSTISLLNTTVEILLKNNGGTNVNIEVTVLYDGNSTVIDGESRVEMVLNQPAMLAVNRDTDGAIATFVAEVGGTYKLTNYSDNVLIYVVAPDGSKTQVLVGAGDYTFHMEGGEKIEFFVNTRDGSAESVTLLLAPDR